ncbi:hypothetical protein H696_06198 [Fonticula alba]|uniref:Uncharacterized protein n=1 Tax=Fonticula alba TaxID=691883 RepID=A0A058YZR8_FONAL|nr:hypothetical protein H696_06198 [Fonticula alba]KCV67376.1 hypothetical protein H696_06198 [Fonticula alba]|eukprot:XP_009498217.1 hypothetical protein H696_06198 [Fonticula alba]
MHQYPGPAAPGPGHAPAAAGPLGGGQRPRPGPGPGASRWYMPPPRPPAPWERALPAGAPPLPLGVLRVPSPGRAPCCPSRAVAVPARGPKRRGPRSVETSSARPILRAWGHPTAAGRVRPMPRARCVAAPTGICRPGLPGASGSPSMGEGPRRPLLPAAPPPVRRIMPGRGLVLAGRRSVCLRGSVTALPPGSLGRAMACGFSHAQPLQPGASGARGQPLVMYPSPPSVRGTPLPPHGPRPSPASSCRHVPSPPGGSARRHKTTSPPLSPEKTRFPSLVYVQMRACLFSAAPHRGVLCRRRPAPPGSARAVPKNGGWCRGWRASACPTRSGAPRASVCSYTWRTAAAGSHSLPGLLGGCSPPHPRADT